MNLLEIIVLVFAILIVLKSITFVFIKKKPFLKLVEKVTKYKTAYSVVLVIGIIAYGYLLLRSLSVVEILAGVILGVGMIGLCLVQFPKQLTAIFKDWSKDRKKMFLGLLFFLILAIWVILKLLVF